MKTKLLVLAGLLLLSTNLFSQDSNFYIYLCFGQSNMEGQGDIETQDKTVDDRFKTFQAIACSNLSRDKETWYTAVPPTCQCYSGLSPVDYFGRTMVANLPDSITIGVINVAIGGCDIRIFDKDIYEDYDSTYTDSWFTEKVAYYDNNPYQYLVDLAQLAQQDGVIKGILLHQGETNTGDASWPTYVKKIYNDMLTDLSLTADSIPLLAGEVLSVSGACCTSMNTIINRLPDTIPTSYIISSDGCTGNDEDNAHFGSAGYRKLGRRYAVQMLSLMGYEAAYAEAECGTVGSDWYIREDEDASNAAYITPIPGTGSSTTAPTEDANIVEMSISVEADTTYYFYGRFNNASTESNSFWIKIDDEDFVLYDDLTTDGWEWIELKSIALTAGSHTISIASAEDGAMIDKVALKNTESLPVDVAEEAQNLCDPEYITGNIEVTPEGYALEQNYPNPFSGTTNISFEIPEAMYVSLKVVNSQGAEIAELAGKEYSSGKHSVEFNTDSLPAGNYLYTIKAGNFTLTKKMAVSAK